MQNIFNHFLVLIATIIISGSFLVSAALASTINPVSLTLLRFICAVLCILPLIFFKKNSVQGIKKALPRSIVISFFYCLFFILQFESLKTTTALNTSTIYSLTPFITAVLGIFLFKEVITSKRMFIYLLAGLGTCWVIFKGSFDTLLSFELNFGDYIFLIASLSMCCYSLAMKLLYRDDDMWILVFCTLLCGCLWISGFLLLSGFSLEWDKLATNDWFNIAYLGILATMGTSYLYQKTTVALGPRRVMSYVYLSPAIVVVLSYLVYNQSISANIYPGIILSALTTFLLQRKDR